MSHVESQTKCHLQYKHVCPLCQQQFSRKVYLNNHLEKHADSTIFDQYDNENVQQLLPIKLKLKTDGFINQEVAQKMAESLSKQLAEQNQRIVELIGNQFSHQNEKIAQLIENKISEQNHRIDEQNQKIKRLEEKTI